MKRRKCPENPNGRHGWIVRMKDGALIVQCTACGDVKEV